MSVSRRVYVAAVWSAASLACATNPPLTRQLCYDPEVQLANVLRPTVMIIGIGLVLGVAGALLTSRLVDTLLFELTSRDPAALAATVIVLSVTALTAGYLPARRASRIDPATALRTE